MHSLFIPGPISPQSPFISPSFSFLLAFILATWRRQSAFAFEKGRLAGSLVRPRRRRHRWVLFFCFYCSLCKILGTWSRDDPVSIFTFARNDLYVVQKGTIKKRDCNLAVPHSEALVLPLYLNSNTVAHAVCIYVYTHMRVYLNTHHEHLSVAMSWIR